MTSLQCKKKLIIDYQKRINEVQEISKKIDFNNLTYYFKTSGISPINFIKFKGPFGFFNEIKNGNISLKSRRRTK